ncbi:hypothetical protein [Flagellimonas meishanensis]|uniref:hypothetical protein n=1 Tax=Flagellimonas meishanensis TaxID=2873264 RepID=UPI001CA78013|nr:hypothetical protein [[Muricauda] meishanensis]
MKNRITNYSLAFCSLLTFFSCSTEEKTVDDVLSTVGRGSILRTVQVISPAMDVLNPDAIWAVEVETQDLKDGGLLKEMRLFATLIDNTPENGTTVSGEAFVKTFAPSEFKIGPLGLPRIGASATLQEMTSAIGVSEGEYNCGDQIELRFEVELTTGQVFTKGDTNPNISGGQFFASPYFYRASLIALLASEELFTGQYQLISEQLGALGAPDYEEGVYTIEAVSNTVRVIRGVPTLPDFGPFGPVDVTFELVCGKIVFPPAQSLGIGCNTAILSGSGETNDTYDLDTPDDSSFILYYISDETNDCASATPAAIRLVKI